jgi:hypothetical protein
MSTKSTVALAFFAGLLGSVVSLQLVPTRAFAQPQAPTPAPAPKPAVPASFESGEIRTQRVVIVDERGIRVGTFQVTTSPTGPRTVAFIDQRGRETWRASGEVFRPLIDGSQR